MSKQTENYISILGLADDVIMYCLKESFDCYLKRSDESFQVSPREAENSTSAILLIGAGLESYVRRLEYIVAGVPEYKEYLDIFKIEKCSKCKRKKFQTMEYKITKIIENEFAKKHPKLRINKRVFSNLLNEFAILRNSIAHNYLYEFSLSYDDDYELQNWNYTDLTNKNTGLKNDRTNNLLFNKIPNQIGFIDVLKALLVFDIVIQALHKYIKGINYRFSGYHKFNDKFVKNISNLLEEYILELHNNKKIADIIEINNVIASIATNLLQVKDKISDQDLASLTLLELEKSTILSETLLGNVTHCPTCKNVSLVLGEIGNKFCLKCKNAT